MGPSQQGMLDGHHGWHKWGKQAWEEDVSCMHQGALRMDSWANDVEEMGVAGPSYHHG
jgi:hypothetical protein